MSAFGILNTPVVLGQIDPNDGFSEKIYSSQIELRHDNDFLHFTDKYYTTGNYIVYRFLANDEDGTDINRQNAFYLGQEIYTPSDLDEIDYTKYDRPYGGFLGLFYQHTVASKKWLFDFKSSFGVTGPWSGAEGLQSLFHETATEDSRVPTWNEQIGNGVTINFYFNYVNEWQLAFYPFSVYFALSPEIALGSKDVYLQQDVVFYFGKRNPMHQSTAYNQIGKLKNEFFFATRFGYRRVIHDTMLEGNLINESSILLMDPLKNVFFYKVEIHYRKKRNDFKLYYNYESSRTKRAKSHYYVTLSLARNF